MKKKMLLFTSSAAMLLSVALLLTPNHVMAAFRCTSCIAIDSSGNRVTANCQVMPVDTCFCPLSGTIVKNGCVGITERKNPQ